MSRQQRDMAVSYGRTSIGATRNVVLDDLENKVVTQTDYWFDGHTESLQTLFGLSTEQLHRWPGAIGYCYHLESCFVPLLDSKFNGLWDALGCNPPQSVRGCWPWFSRVTGTIRACQDAQISITEIWDSLRARSLDPEGQYTVAQEQHAAVALFAVLCWSTMTLQPQLISTETPCFRVLQGECSPLNFSLDNVRRPIPKLFRYFRRIMHLTTWQHHIGGNEQGIPMELHVTALNFATLSKISKIQLVWVDDVTSHLDFDPFNRQLSIFRFPSFSALSIMSASLTTPTAVALHEELYDVSVHEGTQMIDHGHLHQEVLMSFRLLFGQTRGARKLATVELNKLRELKGSTYDKLLDVLCDHTAKRAFHALPSRLWPVTCHDSEGYLQESSSYSSQDDFPMFGQRLAKLQGFSLRQQPSKLRDLWQDRRNPLQWYTFWAVMIFGSVSIALTFVQIFVGVAQLAVSVVQLPEYS